MAVYASCWCPWLPCALEARISDIGAVGRDCARFRIVAGRIFSLQFRFSVPLLCTFRNEPASSHAVPVMRAHIQYRERTISASLRHSITYIFTFLSEFRIASYGESGTIEQEKPLTLASKFRYTFYTCVRNRLS